MLFSIVVPIYNVEQYIDRCIESLMLQTYKDIEIILVDDESPDNCPQICDEYASKDSRIKVLHKTNGGLSDARNAGIRIANGEYIMFVDSDDYISIDACEKFAIFADKKCQIMIGNALVEGGTCNLGHIFSPDIMSGLKYLKAAHCSRRAPMAAWLNVYQRDFLLENELFFKPGILHEDEQFTPRAFLKANSVILTNIDFYHYIIRDGSITTKKDKRKNAVDFYETCCELEKIYNELEDDELKKMLLNSLASRYLSLFEMGDLSKYGRKYLPLDFLKRTASSRKTIVKVKLIGFSPRVYHLIRRLFKKLFA